MTVNVIKPVAPVPQGGASHYINIFLGGSIEMGAAENWQDRVTLELSQVLEHDTEFDYNILNPRRDDWDSSWSQEPVPGTKFHEQVSWEREAQENSDIIVYYFADGTKSPITLLELGEYGPRHDGIEDRYVVVKCGPGFWRYGNVKIFCDDHGIPCVETYEEMMEIIHGNKTF